MKNIKDIELVMSKLKCSKEEIETLSDNAFEVVVGIVNNPQPELSEKDKEFAMECAKKLEQGSYRF